jgi:two-component system, LuxR family, response regulator FixJ
MSGLVYLVDDEGLLRREADLQLRQLGYTTLNCHGGGELLALGKLQYGCILMDVHMAPMGGLEVHDELLRRGVGLPVIFLDGTIPEAVKAMQRGAVDFLEKPVAMAELVPAIERALALGECSEKVSRIKSQAAARLSSLTPRGTQILQGMQAGMANKSIARWLNLSPRTVEVYRATMMAKIGATGVSQALRIALDGELPEMAPLSRRSAG